jgi:small-conductance mechanosensitive channel
MPRLRRAALGLLTASVIATACSAPPTREMNQAQGAIETARAAGADRYAPEEYGAAVAALEKSREMATQRDYRQALNFALDARERAVDAARSGAERMAQVRSEAESAVRVAAAILQVAQGRVKTSGARVADKTPAPLRDAIAQAERDLQEARSAIARQDYTPARDLARAVDQRIREAITAAEQASAKPARKTAR